MEHIITMTGELCRSQKNIRRKPAPPDGHGYGDKARFALRLALKGEWVEIVSVSGGRGCRERLAGMGLRVGAQVQVLRNDVEGKLILSHQGTHLYLGGGMAHKIQVASIKEKQK